MQDAPDPPCLAAALDYLARGWSVLPLCPPDHVGVGKEHRGCKSPGKRPFLPTRPASGEWKEFQSRRMTEDELRREWRFHPRLNVGVALGPVSGLAGIDVDDEDGEELLREISGGDLPATWEYTTGKGRRLLYRLPPGAAVVNQPFRRPGTEIEVLRFMSHGSQVVLPPSGHPNGSAYRWKALRGPDDIPAADAPAWLLGRRVEEGAAARPADGELITQGGRNNYLTALAGAMRKRGADEHAILAALSATNETRCDPPLAEEEVRSVARSVARYAPDEFTGVTIKTTPPGRVPDPASDRSRRFKWASELSAPPKADDWVWEGYLPRGGISLLSAYWKAGKTTLLAHLLRACADGGTFLDKKLARSRVLYVSEEGERHWVRRRDALGIGDHAAFYLQPFPVKPPAEDWLAFVGELRADVLQHGFSLVVFDTLAKLWPVREENDAGDVDAALMPLWELTKAGAAVLLIHHIRKSGGQEFTGSRGSGALSAFPDIIIELTRFDPSDSKSRKRVLKAKGRYDETTPDELVIELEDDRYRALPGEITPDRPVRISAGEPATEEEKILHVLRNSQTAWLTADQIREVLKGAGWGMRAEVVTTHLFSLFDRKQVEAAGEIRNKANPRRYKLAGRPDLIPTHSAPGAEAGMRSGNEMPDPDPDVIPGSHSHSNPKGGMSGNEIGPESEGPKEDGGTWS